MKKIKILSDKHGGARAVVMLAIGVIVFAIFISLTMLIFGGLSGEMEGNSTQQNTTNSTVGFMSSVGGIFMVFVSLIALVLFIGILLSIRKKK